MADDDIPKSSDELAESVEQPSAPGNRLSPGLLRVLRTEVPLIVTLAQKRESAAKILQFGPGTILEFDQSCEKPLQLSVNNLPIGLGEAVKIGEHFGLRILSIVPADDRIESLGEKWSF